MTMMNNETTPFELRPATNEDTDFLFQLRVKTMKPIFEGAFGWNDGEERKKAADELQHARIVMVGETDMGVIKVIPGMEELHVHQMQISPEFQRMGIGEALIRQAMGRAGNEGKPITLFVVKHTPAMGLYERLGFVVTERFEHHCKMLVKPENER